MLARRELFGNRDLAGDSVGSLSERAEMVESQEKGNGKKSVPSCQIYPYRTRDVRNSRSGLELTMEY
jgi:hypothetical protein